MGLYDNKMVLHELNKIKVFSPTTPTSLETAAKGWWGELTGSLQNLTNYPYDYLLFQPWTFPKRSNTNPKNLPRTPIDNLTQLVQIK